MREHKLAGGSAEQEGPTGTAGAASSGAAEEAEGAAGTVRPSAAAPEERFRSDDRAACAARPPQEDRFGEQPPRQDGPRTQHHELRLPHQPRHQTQRRRTADTTADRGQQCSDRRRRQSDDNEQDLRDGHSVTENNATLLYRQPRESSCELIRSTNEETLMQASSN